jgi:hypothetical protein
MAFTGNFTANTFKTALFNGDVDFGADVFKIALYTNSASLNGNTSIYTTDGEVVASGYTAGGEVLTPTVASLDGVSYVTFADVSWSSALTARGALIYKEGGTAVCVLDFGADKTSTTVFQVQFPPATSTSAIIRLS